MKVAFAGGGSGGPVAPLLAVYEQLKERDPQIEALWIGTKKGPEKHMIGPYGFAFRPIYAGKVRRYFSWRNFIDPFLTLAGFFQSILILNKFKPDIVLSAGGFVAVPLFYAAWLLGIPRLTHQQDLLAGLANKMMAKVATKITVTFKESLKDYAGKKTVLTSNPVRKEIFQASKEKALRQFQLDPAVKTILIIGGGQGAQAINNLVKDSLGELTEKYQLIHVVGEGNLFSGIASKRYHGYEFLNQEIFAALKAADLVVSRAGMSFLSELSVLGKPAVLIPLPGHQEFNARHYEKQKAAIVLSQENLNKETFIKTVLNLMEHAGDLQSLSENISRMIDKDAARKYADLVISLINK